MRRERCRRGWAWLMGAAIAVGGADARTALGAALASEVASCRAGVASGVRSLFATSAERMIECHDERMRGLLVSGTDCTAIDDAGFPARSAAAIARAEEHLARRVSRSCDAMSPAAAGYATCPLPCGAMVPSLASLADLSACLACASELDAARLVESVYGAAPPVTRDRTCQHRGIGRSASRYARSLVKAQQACQVLEEKGRLDDVNCPSADLRGSVARAASQLASGLAACSDSELATLTSCAVTAAEEQACVKEAADSAASSLFALAFPESGPTPTPIPTATPVATVAPSATPTPADDCPAASFLDVSQAPGAGASWPAPTLSVSCSATTVTVTSNGIPHYTFVQTTPNALQAGSYVYAFPRHPAVAASATALPLLGTIAVAVNGMTITGPNEAAFPDPYGDPVANAILDECLGHTAPGGNYHYHALLQKCLTASGLVAEPWLSPEPSPDEPSPILGYARDGFPIYGPYECSDASCSSMIEMMSSYDNVGYQSTGCTSSAQCATNYACALSMIDGVRQNACVPKTYAWTNNQYVAKGGEEFLDACNGHYGPGGDYHYHATATFPYVLGCYRGTAS